MAPADHLIERAAALLQGGAALADPAKANAGARLPGAAALADADLSIPEAPGPNEAGQAASSLPSYVPSPPSRPALIFAEQAHNPAAAPAAAEALAPPLPAPAPALPGHALPEPATSAPAPADAPAIGYDLLQAAGMIVARGSRNRISEEYRIVLGRVLRAQREEGAGAGAANLLLITSAKPGEGKSFTSLNLAGSIAQHTAEKVLLVDLDAKMRPMTALLQAGDAPGFYDLVTDPSLPLGAAIRTTAIPNLAFLPVGRRPPDGTGSGGGSVTGTIHRLARAFPQHIIILDAAPCLSTSDPSTVAPIVGQVVMVVEAERTQRSEVEAALDLVRVCPVITMLLNKVRLTTSHTFGAYDYYGNYS